MSIAMRAVDVIYLAGIGLIIGIIANSKNSVGLMNATAALFTGVFNSAASTVR